MKSRTLPTNLGDPADGLYYGVSGGCYSPSGGFTEDIVKAEYLQGKALRNALIQGSELTGLQQFESSSRRPPRMNSCRNFKNQAINLPYGSWIQDRDKRVNSWQPTQLRYSRKKYFRLNHGYTPLVDGDIYHLTEDATGAARRAWWNMQPRFEGEISMLNFLFELKDFKDLAKFVLRPRTSYNKIRKFLRASRRGARPKDSMGRALDESSRGAAGGYLTWQLAIKPLLSDLAAIHANLATLVREAQEEFNARGSEDQTSHYTEVLGLDDSGLTLGTGSESYAQASGKYHKTLFTATMHYNYAYEMRGTVDAFVKYWGLKPTAEAFWNAIPFSFIVDYFIRIGDSLHAMEIDKNVDLRMNDYAESLLSEVAIGEYFVPAPEHSNFYVINGEFKTAITYPLIYKGTLGSLYERRICEPNYGPALPRLKLPSGRQSTIMAAIVRCLL